MSAPDTPLATAAMAQSRLGQAEASQHARSGRAKPHVDFRIGPRVSQATTSRMYERGTADPVYRPLRIYALDPAASLGDGALAVVNVPYEPIEFGPRGPRGAILEIIDDEGPQHAVDLDDKFLLMQQGRLPSPEDMRFRQQMVYAVCTTTYAAFRQALGRDIAWGFRRTGRNSSSRLRIRPNVQELENAYYDRDRGELCFGVFSARGKVAGRNVPGGRVSLCLSHDIVVHEMSHALLDGLRSQFLHPSNLDVLAFHEAFADLVAIFQRFTYLDVVREAIRRSRGQISSATLLTNIAVQFAQTIDAADSLRSAVRDCGRTYEDTTEPHHRGELLVAAVFEAFTTIYQRRTMPLLRLATGGTGVLPQGEIPDVLANLLTERACRLASQFLTICIRAIDYCPPVDITFGEYLRAVLTADLDVVPHDEYAYREAWIDAFAKRRIYPRGVPSLSESALLWRRPERDLPEEEGLSFAMLQFNGDPGRPASAEEMLRQANVFGRLAADPRYRGEFGLVDPNDPALDGDEVGLPIVESIRSSRRIGPSGQIVFDLVTEITQRRTVRARSGEPGFHFYGGATAILDPHGRLRYVVRKSVLDGERLRRQLEFLKGAGQQLFGRGPADTLLPEPKLLLRLHDVTRPELQAPVTMQALPTGPEGARAFPAGMKPSMAETASAQRFLLRTGDKHVSVHLLKTCLNACMRLEPGLDSSPLFDEPTERAVSRFQSIEGTLVDGVVGPLTWAVLGRAMKYSPPEMGRLSPDVPDWIRSLLVNDPATTSLVNMDIARALDLYEYSYGPINASQHEGLSFLLRQLRHDEEVTDLRWAAYMLATVKHECAETWQPIEEFGRGARRAYGKEVIVRDSEGNKYRNKYYGRGYVQLTWVDNYRDVGRKLGMGDRLMIH
ncbi:MAG TPA: peptidoglycan-binding protein, partial [Steroidobacteraceae bacterium]